MTLALAAAITLGVDRVGLGVARARQPPAPIEVRSGVELAVATRDLDAGEAITADMIRFVTVDPGDGLAGVGLLPVGRQLGSAVSTGEIIAETDLQVIDSRGLLAGERAIAIARSTAPLPLEPGDRVEMVSVTAGGDGAARSEVLGSAGRVLSIEDRSVVIAVPAALAPEVVRRQAVGAVQLLRAP